MTGKGTISFDDGERLPVTLIEKVVKTRLAEVGTKSGRPKHIGTTPGRFAT